MAVVFVHLLYGAIILWLGLRNRNLTSLVKIIKSLPPPPAPICEKLTLPLPPPIRPPEIPPDFCVNTNDAPSIIDQCFAPLRNVTQEPNALLEILNRKTDIGKMVIASLLVMFLLVMWYNLWVLQRKATRAGECPNCPACSDDSNCLSYLAAVQQLQENLESAETQHDKSEDLIAECRQLLEGLLESATCVKSLEESEQETHNLLERQKTLQKTLDEHAQKITEFLHGPIFRNEHIDVHPKEMYTRKTSDEPKPEKIQIQVLHSSLGPSGSESSANSGQANKEPQIDHHDQDVRDTKSTGTEPEDKTHEVIGDKKPKEDEGWHDVTAALSDAEEAPRLPRLSPTPDEASTSGDVADPVRSRSASSGTVTSETDAPRTEQTETSEKDDKAESTDDVEKIWHLPETVATRDEYGHRIPELIDSTNKLPERYQTKRSEKGRLHQWNRRLIDRYNRDRKMYELEEGYKFLTSLEWRPEASTDPASSKQHNHLCFVRQDQSGAASPEIIPFARYVVEHNIPAQPRNSSAATHTPQPAPRFEFGGSAMNNKQSPDFQFDQRQPHESSEMAPPSWKSLEDRTRARSVADVNANANATMSAGNPNPYRRGPRGLGQRTHSFAVGSPLSPFSTQQSTPTPGGSRPPSQAERQRFGWARDRDSGLGQKERKND